MQQKMNSDTSNKNKISKINIVSHGCLCPTSSPCINKLLTYLLTHRRIISKWRCRLQTHLHAISFSGCLI